MYIFLTFAPYSLNDHGLLAIVQKPLFRGFCFKCLLYINPVYTFVLWKKMI